MGSTTAQHPAGAHAQPAVTAIAPDVDQAGVLARLHARDRIAFADIYRAHLPRLTRYVAARLNGRDRDVVADLVHDAFADALTEPTLIGADVLGSLLRLCGWACTRHLWSQRRQLRVAHTVYEDHQRAGRHEPQHAPPAGRAATVQAMAALPDAQRRVMHLRFVDGHPRQVTALLLGRSVGTVTYLERQACQRLRAHLSNTAPSGVRPTPATVTNQP